jgi:hypothetical protein
MASHPCGKLVRFVGNRAAGAPWDMQKIIAQIAQEIRVEPRQVLAAVELLDGGATVPFIARYRKSVTCLPYRVRSCLFLAH